MSERYFLTHGPYSIYELRFKGGGSHTVLAVRKSGEDVMEWVSRRGSEVVSIGEKEVNAEILMGETMDYPMCAKFHDAIAEAIRNPDICDDLAIAKAEAAKNLELAKKFARAFSGIAGARLHYGVGGNEECLIFAEAEELLREADYSKAPF